MITSKSLKFLLLTTIISKSSCENGYLGFVKNACFHKGEALSCIKYKAIKLATKTILGSDKSNETLKATNLLSFVKLDAGFEKGSMVKEDFSEPRGILSEWSALTQYVIRVLQQFVMRRGLRVELPEGSKAVEEDPMDESGESSESATGRSGKEDDKAVDDEARGKRKKLAVILPLLSLLATLKTKILLIPVLLAVLFIKKLLLVAALLVPSLLSTLKACKMPHPPHHYSHFGSSDTSSDFSSAGYNGGYAYSSGGPQGYGKDWAASRAYALPKRPPPIYATAPGAVAE